MKKREIRIEVEDVAGKKPVQKYFRIVYLEDGCPRCPLTANIVIPNGFNNNPKTATWLFEKWVQDAVGVMAPYLMGEKDADVAAAAGLATDGAGVYMHRKGS